MNLKDVPVTQLPAPEPMPQALALTWTPEAYYTLRAGGYKITHIRLITIVEPLEGQSPITLDYVLWNERAPYARSFILDYHGVIALVAEIRRTLDASHS